MQRKRLLIGVLAISLLVGLASAALIPYFGKIETGITVTQSILVDGTDYAAGPITETISTVGGNLEVGDDHDLMNYADDTILVKIDPNDPAPTELVEVYPEYKLNAWVYDDAIILELDSAITWTDFTGISFDYLIEADTWETLKATWPELTGPWIPQINIRLLDGDGNVAYYASWHTFRNGITGTVGERTSITYLKDDFYFFAVPGWAPLGLWKDIYASYLDANAMTFSGFSQQAGDTSVDPNHPLMTPVVNPYWPAKSQQIVWVGNHATDATIKGIQARSSVGATGQALEIATVEFRMVYKFDVSAVGSYTVETTILLA